MFHVLYTLNPTDSPNARAGKHPRLGALLRSDSGGFACLHPWPELGDDSLKHELAALREGHPLRLGARALRCMELDGEARREGKNLFENLTIPKSHATLLSSTSLATADTLNQRGFRTGKLKLPPNLKAAARRLITIAAALPEWSWRLDFNATLTHEETLKFWFMLPETLRDRIDFIEDPCTCSVKSWRALQNAGIPLACDMPPPHHSSISSCIPARCIVKPARDHIVDGRPIFTSYMDHPLGQLWAAYCAAFHYRNTATEDVPVCGLVTQHVYQPHAFSIALGLYIKPELVPPPGTGLGFDEMLENLPWKRL